MKSEIHDTDRLHDYGKGHDIYKTETLSLN